MLNHLCNMDMNINYKYRTILHENEYAINYFFY